MQSGEGAAVDFGVAVVKVLDVTVDWVFLDWVVGKVDDEETEGVEVESPESTEEMVTVAVDESLTLPPILLPFDSFDCFNERPPYIVESTEKQTKYTSRRQNLTSPCS